MEKGWGWISEKGEKEGGWFKSLPLDPYVSHLSTHRPTVPFRKTAEIRGGSIHYAPIEERFMDGMGSETGEREVGKGLVKRNPPPSPCPFHTPIVPRGRGEGSEREPDAEAETISTRRTSPPPAEWKRRKLLVRASEVLPRKIEARTTGGRRKGVHGSSTPERQPGEGSVER